ncbi:polyphosphate polymerase domain-containing protein [Zongyangia hominis]|uniref:Polyphosphate polymerase domain-containing protein n=1 Tax=Zongyangia hominis TaxID=2763677 RepID=A0A926EDU8_9FIRM|nr:polyphosphate polymerase domain-containing protein [Zongyangia hominis]MBC8570291.1 polyphosphate polymerase domain-containing protein [Zongyangia hominis]
MGQLLEVQRTEQKYRMDVAEAERLGAVLGQVLHPDEHNGPYGYPVRSLYFDTLDDTDYYNKLVGHEIQRQLRLRIYGPDAATAKLELKEEQDALQRKRSLILSRAAAQRLCAGDLFPLLEEGSSFALELYSRMQRYVYRPKCVVEYDRKAFFVAEYNTRITLDSGLRASECNLNLFSPRLLLYPVGKIRTVTMEVKFDRFLPSHVKVAVSLRERVQTSVTKYCTARSVTLRKQF